VMLAHLKEPSTDRYRGHTGIDRHGHEFDNVVQYLFADIVIYPGKFADASVISMDTNLCLARGRKSEYCRRFLHNLRATVSVGIYFCFVRYRLGKGIAWHIQFPRLTRG